MLLALYNITGPGYVAIEATQEEWSIGIACGQQCFYILGLRATFRGKLGGEGGYSSVGKETEFRVG